MDTKNLISIKEIRTKNPSSKTTLNTKRIFIPIIEEVNTKEDIEEMMIMSIDLNKGEKASTEKIPNK